MNKRLDAIKFGSSEKIRKCSCCGWQIGIEEMWTVTRHSHHGKTDYHYCTNCMLTAEQVLHEIDTDDNPYGIFGVDPIFLKDKVEGITKLKELEDITVFKN